MATDATPSTAAKNDKQQPKADKPKKKRSIGRWFKEIFSELKKVSWPTFGKVMKQLGIVLAVVLFFLVVFFAFDFGLSKLYALLIKGLTDGTATVSSALSSLGSIIGPGIL